MEVKKTRKIRGFLSIELLLVLSVTAILGGISLYFGKRVVDKAMMVKQDVEAQMFIAVLFEYHDLTGKWPVGTKAWISVRSFDNLLRRKFDEALYDNPYSLSKEHPEEFPNMWIYIDVSVGSNQTAEDIFGGLQQRTQRNVSNREVRNFKSVRYFFPKKGEGLGYFQFRRAFRDENWRFVTRNGQTTDMLRHRGGAQRTKQWCFNRQHPVGAVAASNIFYILNR